MLMYNLIDKKRLKQALTQDEINWIVENFVNKQISNEEMSSFLMAVCLNGMNEEETYYMTKAMQKSGETVKFDYDTVDKHSTGGLSDSTTLLLAPIMANLGIKLAKMSGRGLGTTGGTIDKLEVFDGYKVDKSFDEFNNIIKEVGASIVSQSKDIAVADKLIYALRDKTATIASIPLIASSVMSKKLAMGSNIILLDVKYGKGAFMPTKHDAVKLAKTMVDIGKRDGKTVWAVISNMNIPLSDGVGCAQEVYSVISTMKGCDNNLLKVTKELAVNLYVMATGADRKTAELKVSETINNGIIDKFKEIIQAHGGSIDVIDKQELLLNTSNVITINASESGYIADIDALEIAKFVMQLKSKVGADRTKFQGVLLKVSYGDKILEGDALVTIYTDTKLTISDKNDIRNVFKITPKKPKKLKLIEKVVK